MLGLATSNYLNGSMGELGVKVLFYYNAGPLLGCIIYFIAKSRGCFGANLKRDVSRDTGVEEARTHGRSLLRDGDGKLDFKIILCLIISAAF